MAKTQNNSFYGINFDELNTILSKNPDKNENLEKFLAPIAKRLFDEFDKKYNFANDSISSMPIKEVKSLHFSKGIGENNKENDRNELNFIISNYKKQEISQVFSCFFVL